MENELSFFCSTALYQPANEGKHNLYKFFICRANSLVAFQGVASFIVPMSLLGNEQDKGLRKLLAGPTTKLSIDAFPQKDDPEQRVFREAKLSTAVFVVRPRSGIQSIIVRTHSGAVVSDGSPMVALTLSDIIEFDSGNMPFPSCSQDDWRVAIALLRQSGSRRLGAFCTASQGEVNETTDGKKGFVSKRAGDGPLILRGAAIGLYIVRDASQGTPIYLRKEQFLSGKPDSEKTLDHLQARVGWQESSAQNNFRRIIAAAIPPGHFCNHKINYIPEKSSKLPLDFVLAVLNSKLSDWFFRLSSTSAAVSHYQIQQLPIPTMTDQSPPDWWANALAGFEWIRISRDAPFDSTGHMPKYVMHAIEEMCRAIRHYEAKRHLLNRSERSQLSEESEPIQCAIDRLFFRCFGLSHDQTQHIEDRLMVML